MEIVLVILLLIGVMFLGRFLSRPAQSHNRNQNRPPQRRRRNAPPPPPPMPPRPLVQRIQRRLWRYVSSFAYHCGMGVIMGFGLYFGLCDKEMSRHIKANLIFILVTVIIIGGMSQLPIVGDLLRGATKQVPKQYKARVIRWCWTNGISAVIVMAYMASRNAPTLF